jgi:hypothetical protein
MFLDVSSGSLRGSLRMGASPACNAPPASLALRAAVALRAGVCPEAVVRAPVRTKQMNRASESVERVIFVGVVGARKAPWAPRVFTGVGALP